MRKVLGLVIMVFAFSYLNVFGIEKCKTTEIGRLSELAKNVTFKQSYELVEEEELTYVNYKIEILNTNPDLKIQYLDEFGYRDITPDEISNMVFLEGDNLSFQIISYTNNLCTNRVLRTENIKLLYYNEFYHKHKDFCDSPNDFKYCSEFIDKSLEIDDIEELYKEYKNDNKIIIESENNNNLYYYIGGGLLLIIVIIFIFVILKKKKKNSI